MESLSSEVARTCVRALQRMAVGQTPHPKIFYCHDNNMDVPSNLMISCRICGRSVESQPHRIYLNFFETGNNSDVSLDSSSESGNESRSFSSD